MSVKKHRHAQLKFVSSLFIGPTVHDAVREGHQTMSNMEDYNDASAMAAPGTHQLSAGLENNSPAQGNCSGLNMHRHHNSVFVYVCVCACVWLKISDQMKNTQKWFFIIFSVPQM